MIKRWYLSRILLLVSNPTNKTKFKELLGVSSREDYVVPRRAFSRLQEPADSVCELISFYLPPDLLDQLLEYLIWLRLKHEVYLAQLVFGEVQHLLDRGNFCCIS